MQPEALLTAPENSGNSVMTYLKENYTEIFGTLFTERETEHNTRTKTPKFTERNLTVNFAEAVKKCYPGSVCWYEFPFNSMEKNGKEPQNPMKILANKHFDAVIVSPSEDPFVLICEAKRNFPEKGTRKIETDIQRIQKYGRRVEKAVSKEKEYKYFGAIILDGWADEKNNRLNGDDLIHWNNEILGVELFNKAFDNVKDKIPEQHAEFHISFNDVEPKNTVHKTIRAQYTIKVIVWEIQAGK